MVIDKTIFQTNAPSHSDVIWAKPEEDKITLHMYNRGKWMPVSGSGNDTTVTKYPVDPNAPMLSKDSFMGAIMEAATKLGIDTTPPFTQDQTEQIINELKSVKFATPKQGNAVIVDSDLDSNIFTFQCDDGSYITFNGETFVGLRPDIDGYLIWKTTRDKLPVRGSQEETDPEEPNPGGGISLNSVKPGLLGGIQPVDPSTEEVYTVINNNTGEIVDPLELHKLTNVIWYYYFGIYYPFYLNGVEDFNLHKDGIYYNDDYISSWVCMPCFNVYFTYLTVLLYYDYTLKPGSSVRIKTTNNYAITDINTFFN